MVVREIIRDEAKETRRPECWITARSLKSARMKAGFGKEMKTELVSRVISELGKWQRVGECSKEEKRVVK